MSLKGRTFRFNDEIDTGIPVQGRGFKVVCEVDGQKIYFAEDADGTKYKEIEASSSMDYVGQYPPYGDATFHVYNNDTKTWIDEKYKTITFIEEPTGFTQGAMPFTRTEEEFEQFLLGNCTEIISEIETITDLNGVVHHLRDETVPDQINDTLKACGLVYYNGGLYVDPDQT